MNVVIADRTKTAVILVVTAILGFVLYVSRDHITHTAYMIGLHGYQAETLFILIDVVALIGKVLMMKYFAKSTRTIGLRMLLIAGSLSLLCNVTAGTNFGERIYGAGIVFLFIGLEQVVTRIKPAASVKAAKTRAANAADAATPAATATVVTRRKCQTGCTCKRHNRTVKRATKATGQPLKIAA